MEPGEPPQPRTPYLALTQHNTRLWPPLEGVHTSQRHNLEPLGNFHNATPP